jgi:hypothetical protein
MKRIVLLILVLLLTADLAEDGCLGKAKFILPYSSTKTSVTSSHHLHSKHIDFQHKIAATDLPESPWHNNAHPIILSVPATLQLIHCCHRGSAGGIPL